MHIGCVWTRFAFCLHHSMRRVCGIDGCKLDFSCPQSLYVHRKRVHQNEEFECKVPACTKKYKQSAGLWRHVQSSHRNNDMRYPCTVPGCDKDFSAESSVVAHVRDFHEKRGWPCTFEGCSKIFSTSGCRSMHVRGVHLGLKPFVCDHHDCSAFPPSFSHRGNLTAHMTAHHSTEGRKRKKKEEEAMKNKLVSNGFTEAFDRGRVPPPGNFVRETYFDHRCALGRDFMKGEQKCAYVDFVVTSPDGRVVFLEVDEDQHKNCYPQMCETTRMWNICESIKLAGLEMNVFWLRFNPNGPYTVGGVEHDPMRDRRRGFVCDFIKDMKPGTFDKPMEIGYACYDQHEDGRPLVLDDPEYHPDVIDCVSCICKKSANLIQPIPFVPLDAMFAPLPTIDWNDDKDDAAPPPKRVRV